MEMLVFDQANLEYVALVQFSSISTRTARKKFTGRNPYLPTIHLLPATGRKLERCSCSTAEYTRL